jgi:hypothetical protein
MIFIDITQGTFCLVDNLTLTFRIFNVSKFFSFYRINFGNLRRTKNLFSGNYFQNSIATNKKIITLKKNTCGFFNTPLNRLIEFRF